MGRFAVLLLLLCPFALSAADAATESAAAIISPAPGMAQPAVARNLVQTQPRMAPVDSGEKLWRISALALVASSAFDAASSYGKYEGNSFLQSADGSFGMKGIAIKSSLAVSVLAVEQLLRKRYGHSRAFAIANFFQAGVTAGVAARNLTIPRMR